MKLHVVIIDDEQVFREDLAALLRMRGFECKTAADIDTGIQIARSLGRCAVLCDVVMPKGGAIALLHSLSEEDQIGFFVMTAFGSLETAMNAFRSGAVDYLLKPLNIEEVERKVRGFFDCKGALHQVRLLRNELSRLTDTFRLVGKSSAIAHVHEFVKQVAPVRVTVLIMGETGTGKEVTARLIHESGPWKTDPFVAVNCAALPETLFESEVFGHVKGAFTDAIRDKIGLFEAAEEGTLFLDEVNGLSLASQAKLLRALEQKQIMRVGSTQLRTVSARIVTASAQPLNQLVKERKFREDLYFRLAVMEFHLPTLRERREDIPLLVDHFVRRFSSDLKKEVKGVEFSAMQRLIAYSWPGNVRELQNVIERAVILAQREQIGLAELPTAIAGDAPAVKCSDSLNKSLKAYEREYILQVLAASNGNKQETARRLGIDPATLYRKLADTKDTSK